MPCRDDEVVERFRRLRATRRARAEHDAVLGLGGIHDAAGRPDVHVVAFAPGARNERVELISEKSAEHETRVERVVDMAGL